MVTLPPPTLFLLLLHNCKFAIVMNYINICFLMVLYDPMKGSFDPKQAHVENHCLKGSLN